MFVMSELVTLRGDDSLVLPVPASLVFFPKFWHKTKEPETGGANHIARQYVWQSLRFIFKHFVIRKSKMCFLVLFHCTLRFFGRLFLVCFHWTHQNVYGTHQSVYGQNVFARRNFL